MPTIFSKAAEKYIGNNISVIPTDNSKRSIIPWKEYQSRIMTPQEIQSNFNHITISGIAAICGKVSGNLEVIDIDTKNDVKGDLYQNIIDNVPDEIQAKLKVIQTRSGGYHFYYRCEVIEGNQKFAMRRATEQELKQNPHLSQVVLIESRGEGGYVIAPPTEGYKTISKNKDVQHITEAERDLLLEILRSFNEVIEHTTYVPKERTGYNKKPWEDYNERVDVAGLLSSHGWTQVNENAERIFFKRPGNTDSKSSGDFHKEKRLFKVFTTSSQFDVGKGYSPFGIYTLLEHHNNPSKAAKALIEDGYGEKASLIPEKIRRPIKKMREEGYTDDQIKDKLIRDHSVSTADASTVMADFDKQNGDVVSTFWNVDEKGKITISRNKLDLFLRDGGFSLFFYDQSSGIYRIVKQTSGMIEEVSIERIKKFIKSYVYSLEPIEPFDHGTTASQLMEVILKGSDAYFSKSFLEFLDEKRFDFFRDTKDSSYFFFKNGVVCVGADGIALKNYSDINKVIWKSQVIDFNVSLDPTVDESLCEFSKFLHLVSGKDEERYEYAQTLIGYILHKYKHASRPYAIILAEETEDETKGGGTGKGIFVKAISYLTKTDRVDGKNFNIGKNFAFQRVGLDTRVVAIEDVRKNVDFEGFYSIITEGMTVEKKNKDELFISYADSPKILFTTNYTITTVGEHSKRRQRVFEFSPYFSSTYTPVDEFGHQLFDEWDEDEWNRFYNFMFICQQKYLKHGLKAVSSGIKMKRKHIRLSFGEEFLEYFDMITSEQEQWMLSTEAYHAFLLQSNFEKKDYSHKRWKKGISQASEMLGYKMDTRKNRQAGNVMEFIIHGESSTRGANNDTNPLHFEGSLEQVAKEAEEYYF
jgi:hypothetical protein